MAVLPISRFDDPLFRGACSKVSLEELKTPEFQKFLDDFAETCKKGNAIGLGAPQVGVHKRVIVVNIPGGKDGFPLTWMINPIIVAKSNETAIDAESSVSWNIEAQVPRSTWIIVKGLDRDGNKVRLDIQHPFHARVFQHEIGYLNGELFTDLAVEDQPTNRLGIE